VADVLLTTDGSDTATAAARRAIEVLGDRLGRATVLIVVPATLPLAPGGAGVIGAEAVAVPLTDVAAAADVDDERRRHAHVTAERTVSTLGINADIVVADGDPAIEICRVAGEGSYDLVVVGSHGSGLVKRVLLGSVSDHVVRHCAVPVLVVRERAE
jgi:nucleotide-binding universal stress UspA family protein